LSLLGGGKKIPDGGTPKGRAIKKKIIVEGGGT